MKRLALLLCVALFASAQAPDDQPHAFDFEFGAWNVQIRALEHPLSGAHQWIHYRGTHVVQKIWNGRGNLGVLEIDGLAGHIEGMQIRLYNPHSHRWSMTFASSANGTLGEPAIGGFANGRGEFYDKEPLNGRTVLARTVVSDIKPNSYRDVIAFSKNGGKTWEVNWIADYTRIR